MSELNNLQTQVQDLILKEVFENHPDIIGHLEVYYQGYRFRLLEILTTDYPQSQALINKLLGEHKFDDTGFEYIQQYPSHHFSVRYFGQHLSHFLAQNKPYSEHPYLSELADFEWCIAHSLDAANAELLDINTLKTIPPEVWGDLVFDFHPSVQYRIYQWNTPSLFKNKEAEPQKQGPIACIFWRKHISSVFEVLPPTHQSFYNSIFHKKNFADLCEDLLKVIPEEQHETIPATAIGILQYWIENGIITGYNY